MAGQAAKKAVQDQRFKRVHALENRVVRDQRGRARMRSGSRLERVRSPQAMESAKAGGQIGDFQVGGYPIQVGGRVQRDAAVPAEEGLETN